MSLVAESGSKDDADDCKRMQHMTGQDYRNDHNKGIAKTYFQSLEFTFSKNAGVGRVHIAKLPNSK